MPALSSYDYAIVRVVPRVERGEHFNAGIIVFCRTRAFLAARVAVDVAKLAALAPELDAAAVCEHVDLVSRIVRGHGPIGALPQAERFHWLTAPRSTVVQTSPVHCGLCSDPAAALDALFERTVARTADV